MANKSRQRYESNSSTDSSLLDADSVPYATIVDVESSANLLNERKAKEAEDKGRNYQCIAIVSLVFSVVCLLTVIGGGCFCYFYVYRGIATMSSAEELSVPENEKVCMPCAEVSPSPLEEFEYPISQLLEVTVGDDGESTCCAQTPAQYAALFKLILKRQEAVKKLADVLGLPRTSENNSDNDDKKGNQSMMDFIGGNAVSAHLLTKPMSPLYQDSEGRAMQQWKSPEESPVSHVRQGLRFMDNKIYVQSPGLYFVYCQILYNRSPGDDLPHDSVASNYVRRHSLTFPSSSGILLKARHTRGSGQDDRHSSWVGGLFFLHAGDQLFVQVSVPELVSHDDMASFFGLFKVGN